jgi:hypothetical protein
MSRQLLCFSVGKEKELHAKGLLVAHHRVEDGEEFSQKLDYNGSRLRDHSWVHAAQITDLASYPVAWGNNQAVWGR